MMCELKGFFFQSYHYFMKYVAYPKIIKTQCQNSKDCVVEVHQSGFLSFLPVLEVPLELQFGITNI